jgi:hypothetical protein
MKKEPTAYASGRAEYKASRDISSISTATNRDGNRRLEPDGSDTQVVYRLSRLSFLRVPENRYLWQGWQAIRAAS